MSRVGVNLLYSVKTTRSLFYLFLFVTLDSTRASEFPERECCDPIYPIPEPTSKAPSAPTPTGRSGSNIKSGVAILNCLLARQLCFTDTSCSAILEIIPRVCGPELVACSTITVTKCQAALKTLQAFSFFRPTCLCKEPHVDPECHSFQNFLFDHPCLYVRKKDKDAFKIDTLVTCNHALAVCQHDKTCSKVFKDFKDLCKTRNGKCVMENRDACNDAWTELRQSPMFGCICPGNNMKKRCDKIFFTINHNVCVDFLPYSASLDLSGTDSALYPFDPQQENFQEIWLPPTSMYPYFLFPATARTFNNYDHIDDHHRHGNYDQIPEMPGSTGGRQKVDVYSPYDGHNNNNNNNNADGHRKYDGNLPSATFDGSLDNKNNQNNINNNKNNINEGISTSSSASSTFNHNNIILIPIKHDYDKKTAPEHFKPREHDYNIERHEKNHLDKNNNNQHNHNNYNNLHHRHHDRHHHSPDALSPAPPPLLPAPAQPKSPLTPDVANENHHPLFPSLKQPGTNIFAPNYEHGPIIVDRIDDDFGLPIDGLYDLREAFEGFIAQVKIISHPDNSTSIEVIESQLENPLIDADHQDLRPLKQLALPSGFRHRPHHHRNHTNDHSNNDSSSEMERTIYQPVKLILSSTCHEAYNQCRSDPECRRLLEPVINHCDISSCARNECMNSLQNFYEKANNNHSMEIAFCLCKKTQDKHDECISAQEQMHPICAQGHDLTELPTCHSLAEACREDKICRDKLEYYEQSCAVDSVTKKCAGPPSDCRKAMLRILGTELRSNCACKGTDLTQLYDCLGWQRLLWVNTCVVESQKDFHARKKHHHHLHSKTTTSTEIWATSATFLTTTPTITDSVEEDNVIPEVTKKPTTLPAITSDFEISSTTTTSTSSTTMSSTVIASTVTIRITTPSTTTTSTIPPRFCVFQRQKQNHQYIREGKGKRLYHENEPECSDLCQCDIGANLICNTICVKSSPCKTDFAFYNHAAPAYQAYRGRCLCYSGRFICMRPSPDSYTIPLGVFMFLGYSETDENLLKTHNNLTVLDAVHSLDHFMREQSNNKTVCTLFLYNVTRENVIAVARIGGDNSPRNSSQAQSLDQLLRIKKECTGILQDLSDKINNKHQEVHTHPLLSIFKMAEVEVKLPHSSKAVKSTSPSFIILFFILPVTIFIQFHFILYFNNNYSIS